MSEKPHILIRTVKDELTIVFGSYKDVTDNVNLFDLTNFILRLHKETWVPGCYWDPNIENDLFNNANFGAMHWAIYSYLVSKKIMFIEDEYFDNPKYPSRTERYKLKKSFDNRLIPDLYEPILVRLIDNNYFKKNGYNFFIDVSYIRDKKLKELGI